ncbi:MAG: site-specific integrase, partial [Rhodocyclaceae bacterium]
CWHEIDLDTATWIIPGERDRARGLLGMKMKRAHTIPLPRQAVKIFRDLHAYSGDRDLVFPNRNDPTRPISDGTINSALRAMGYVTEQVSGHGFRATAASALAEMGFRKEVIDRQLSHQEKDQVMGAYVHQAEYLEERRAMLQQWADYLDNLQAGGNVVPMKKARARGKR